MDRLEDEVREGESVEDLILLLRGGVDTEETLLRAAHRLERRYTYFGRPARGLSLFGATNEVDTRAILGSKFRRFETYRAVEATRLAQTGLLLPTFTAPHWTLMVLAPDSGSVEERGFFNELLGILGPDIQNPKYEQSTTQREG